jgi:hypothetical protein
VQTLRCKHHRSKQCRCSCIQL